MPNLYRMGDEDRMKLYLRFTIISLLLMAFAGAASAATVSYTATPIGPSPTDWVNQLLAVQKFDPALGTLVSVQLDFTSSVQGIVGVENLGGAAPVTLKLAATTQITQGATTIASLAPSETRVVNLPFADGLFDWGGDSGEVYSGFAGTDTASFTYMTAGDMAQFIGAGTVSYNASAFGNSQTTGSGNIASYYMTQASAGATVTYIYETPEPGSMVALVTGIVGLAGLVSRRKRQV